jgi:hypothetical protein
VFLVTEFSKQHSGVPECLYELSHNKAVSSVQVQCCVLIKRMLNGTFLLLFETGSHYATQAGLELMILQPQLLHAEITDVHQHTCLCILLF